MIAVAERLGATCVATIDHRTSGRSAPHTATPSNYCLRYDLERTMDSENRASPSPYRLGVASLSPYVADNVGPMGRP